MLFNKKFDLIVSIGEDCAVAGYLNKLGLRTFSSPFDWVNGSSLSKRIDLLINGFQDWLNENYIEKLVGDDETNPEKYMRDNPNLNKNQIHESFINTLTGIKFHHDFVYRMPFKDNIVLVQELYNRRINKLLEAIKNANCVLLVYLARHNEEFNTLEILAKKLQKYANNKVSLLYIEHNSVLSEEEIIIRKKENLHFVQINNISTDTTTDFSKLMGNIPVIERLITKLVYEVNMESYYSHLYKVPCLYKIAKLLINLLPLKSLRHKYRDKLRFYLNHAKL